MSTNHLEKLEGDCALYFRIVDVWYAIFFGGCHVRKTPRRRPNSETGCCPTTFSAAHKLSAGEDQKDSEADQLGRSLVNISIKEEKREEKRSRG